MGNAPIQGDDEIEKTADVVVMVPLETIEPIYLKRCHQAFVIEFNEKKVTPSGAQPGNHWIKGL